MLFGRRKPGFSKEVELRPEDISEEFSDLNDPARQDANPKTEKKEMGDRAQAVIDGTAVSAAAQNEEGAQKVDIFDYMDSLPEVEDPFEPSENPIIDDPNEEKETDPQLTQGEVLAEYIRERTRAVQLTPRKPLAEEEPNLDAMIEEMRGLESCKDIRSVKGQKDEYFYSDEIMANNYAMIAMLVYEKDIPHTIAQIVRHNCKIYPSPTPKQYFTRHPFYYTNPQIDHALHMIEQNEAYKDIKKLETWNHQTYLYSEDIMSYKYAYALADDAETDEGDRR
ncbi:MAG: hypothetical protein ACI4MP_08030 [Candidatus Ventricola sp.]